MSEKFDFVANRDTFPGMFLVEAVVQGKVLDKVVETRKQGELFDIEFKINGVEVPFSITLNDVWKRANAELTERARKMAKEMITEAGLDDIRNVLQNAEWELKAAIDKVILKND